MQPISKTNIMKRALFLLAVVAVALSGCKSKVPETKRFPNATIQFQYREEYILQTETGTTAVGVHMAYDY